MNYCERFGVTVLDHTNEWGPGDMPSWAV